MQARILSLLQDDLDAVGLRGRVRAEEEIGHWEADELLEHEADPDRPLAGTVGLAHPLPLLPAPRSSRELRAAAEFMQSFLVETRYLQWPVCLEHENKVLTPQVDGDACVWVCLGSGDQTHVLAPIGALGQATTAVAIRGRLPRKRR